MSHHGKSSAYLTFAIDDQRVVLHVKVGVLSLCHHTLDRFVVEEGSSSAFAAYDLHVGAGCFGDQFVFSNRLPYSSVIDLNERCFYQQMQYIIDRSGRDAFCLTNLLQLGGSKGLWQLTYLLQHHVPHLGVTHFVLQHVRIQLRLCGVVYIYFFLHAQIDLI